VNQEESEQNEVDGMKKRADSTGVGNLVPAVGGVCGVGLYRAPEGSF